MSDPISGLMGAPEAYRTLTRAMAEAVDAAGHDRGPAPAGELNSRVLSWLDTVLEAADVLPPLWREVAASQAAFAPAEQPLQWGPLADERAERRLTTMFDLVGARTAPREAQEVAWASMVLMHTGRESRTSDLMPMIDKCKGISPFAHDMARVRTALLAIGASEDAPGEVPKRTVANLNALLQRFTDDQIRSSGDGSSDGADVRVRVLTTLLRSIAEMRLPVGSITTQVPDVCGTHLKQARALLADFALDTSPVDAVQAPPNARQPRLEGGWVVLAQSPGPGAAVPLDTTVSVFFAKPKETANPALLPRS